ncbi:hypothetical protein RTM1035_10820 [Roseovarius sp. TM1035]|nr:hypothetical protein RTM1035_10820 [Roseovarius sp. TM1035]
MRTKVLGHDGISPIMAIAPPLAP